MTAQAPADYLNGAARAAWYRLHANLLDMGAWNDLDVIGLELVAMACAGYMAGAGLPDSDHKACGRGSSVSAANACRIPLH